MDEMSAEERARMIAACAADLTYCKGYACMQDFAIEQIRQAEAAARRKALEEAARQSAIQGLINPRERENADVCVRSWNAAVVKCRDVIRALAESTER